MIRMKNIHQLKNLEQVKAMAHPIRLRILELLRDKPMTTKQVATVLGEKPTKLYHHIDLLEETGLIQLVETRQNRNMIEKYFVAIAADFIVDRRVLELSKGTDVATGEYESLFLSTLESTLIEARRSVGDKLISSVHEGQNALMWRQKFNGSKEQMQHLTQILRQWLETLPDVEHYNEGDCQSNLTIAFYPVRKETTLEETK